MESTLQACSLDELEERAMAGEAAAARELARRYREGADGMEQDTVMAAMCQQRAEQMDPDGTPPADDQTPSRRTEPADPFAMTRDELFARWHAAYRQGGYDNALSRELQNEERAGNPYAAFVLACRYRDSESETDRSEAIPLLERTRTLLEARVRDAGDADARTLLVQVLTLLGRLYAGEESGQEDLGKGLEYLHDARDMDPDACEDLLWFYQGPARRMQRFARNPGELDTLRFDLAAKAAEKGGIARRLQFALQCRQENRYLQAKD